MKKKKLTKKEKEIVKLRKELKFAIDALVKIAYNNPPQCVKEI